LFKELVVQRSRAYVKASQEQAGETGATFPERKAPVVQDYSIKRTYGALLKKVEDAFNKEQALFTLAIYAPAHYLRQNETEADAMERGRQEQVVALIRTLFLKRFESSVASFELSCIRLFQNLLRWVKLHSQGPEDAQRLERWTTRHQDLLEYARERQQEINGLDEEDDDPIEDAEPLDPNRYDIARILQATYEDLDQVSEFLRETRRFKPANDDKLQALVKLLTGTDLLRENKVLIFSEYRDTARYLFRQLAAAGITGLDEVDSGNADRNAAIGRFAPYYNGSSSAELDAAGIPETRVLISTDVLAEGLNLQDATFLVNYDLHWNPVRLMQRIGRVDRRLNPDTEARLLHDHPERAGTRGIVEYWNFLPPEELDRLLKLYERVAHKTLRISKTFGIEGRKLLTPNDDFEALHEFNAGYEGTTSPEEQMLLEYQKLLQDNPGLAEHLDGLPGRLFSGQANAREGRAVFFCYALPGPKPQVDGQTSAPPEWVPDYATGWYLVDLASGDILTEPSRMVDLIRAQPDTPRQVALTSDVLREAREKVEKHIKDQYLRAKQAPVGAKATLRAWMSLA
ncbi:MAG TPA: helicase-related protein, partial [Deinococcales bacterium]|nr:helicase-related protein [Deinococcales bacterium]